MHLVESKRELHAVVGDSIMEAHSLVKADDIGALTRLLGVYVVACLLDQSSESFGMVFLYRSSLLQEIGKVLRLMFSRALIVDMSRIGHTREDAMLCLRRFNRVFIPIYISQSLEE